MTIGPAAANDGADDLAILYPDRTATIGGVSVTMHEYTFIEGMRLHEHVTPLVTALSVFAQAPSVDPTALDPVFADNAEHVRALMAASSGQPVEWIDALGDMDGQALRLLWWAVNGPFFGRRVVQHLLAQVAVPSAGPTSTLHSPAPVTAATVSPTTPAAN